MIFFSFELVQFIYAKEIRKKRKVKEVKKNSTECNEMCPSSGREYQKNDPAVTVDYNTADPVVRWDSYENFNQRYQDSLEGNKLIVFNLNLMSSR